MGREVRGGGVPICTKNNLLNSSGNTSLISNVTIRIVLLLGRKQSILPAPLCCTGDNCSYKPYMQRRNTFLTTARSSKYVQAVKGLACSLAKSNPGSHLIIMGTASDTQSLTAAELDYLKHNASLPGLDVEYKTVNDIDFPNHENKRFHLNWVKLQAWNLSEWDAIIMVRSRIRRLSSN